MKHKWHKEIKAWADGAEIENRFGNTWVECKVPQWGEQTEYRIKPTPKEPQYLYVWKDVTNGQYFLRNFPNIKKEGISTNPDCIGKIKLEDE